MVGIKLKIVPTDRRINGNLFNSNRYHYEFCGLYVWKITTKEKAGLIKIKLENYNLGWSFYLMTICDFFPTPPVLKRKKTDILFHTSNLKRMMMKDHVLQEAHK